MNKKANKSGLVSGLDVREAATADTVARCARFF